MPQKNPWWCKMDFQEFRHHYKKMSDEAALADLRESCEAIDDLDDSGESWGALCVRAAKERIGKIGEINRENITSRWKNKTAGGDSQSGDGGGREAVSPAAPADAEPKMHKFTPPTSEEVRAECSSRGMQDISEAFIGFYESNGWKVGKNPMKSWKGALTTWQHREVVRKSSPPRYESESARTSRINNEFMSRKNAGESSESIAADFEKRKAAGTL